jgi:hypothetical protein
MAISISTAVPSYGILVMADTPYILLNTKADAAHTIRLKYISSNPAKNTSNVELAAFASTTDAPHLPVEYHPMVQYLATALIAEELAHRVDAEGKPMFPQMGSAAKYYRELYNSMLQDVKEKSRKRLITGTQQRFSFSGAEREILRGVR